MNTMIRSILFYYLLRPFVKISANCPNPTTVHFMLPDWSWRWILALPVVSLLKKLATNKLKVLNAFPTSYELPVRPALEFNFEEKDYHVVGPEVDNFQLLLSPQLPYVWWAMGSGNYYYPPHTCWCGPPVNGEYQHWLQPVALTG